MFKKFRGRVQKFKENFRNAKSQPKSKRKAFFLGTATVLGIFGITLLVPLLPAVAKDIIDHTNIPKPNEVSPVPTLQPSLFPSDKILERLKSRAATRYYLAVPSVFYIVGGVCGLLVVIVILRVEGR